MAVATIGLNASLWMRHKAMAAARGGWGEADFVAALTALGCSTPVIDALRDALAPHYSAGLAPRPDDDFAGVLRIDRDEIAVIVDRLSSVLALPVTRESTPPALDTVGDLATYIQRRVDQLTSR